jgi:hypothetical protein
LRRCACPAALPPPIGARAVLPRRGSPWAPRGIASEPGVAAWPPRRGTRDPRGEPSGPRGDPSASRAGGSRPVAGTCVHVRWHCRHAAAHWYRVTAHWYRGAAYWKREPSSRSLGPGHAGAARAVATSVFIPPPRALGTALGDWRRIPRSWVTPVPL